MDHEGFRTRTEIVERFARVVADCEALRSLLEVDETGLPSAIRIRSVASTDDIVHQALQQHLAVDPRSHPLVLDLDGSSSAGGVCIGVHHLFCDGIGAQNLREKMLVPHGDDTGPDRAITTNQPSDYVPKIQLAESDGEYWADEIRRAAGPTFDVVGPDVSRVRYLGEIVRLEPAVAARATELAHRFATRPYVVWLHAFTQALRCTHLRRQPFIFETTVSNRVKPEDVKAVAEIGHIVAFPIWAANRLPGFIQSNAATLRATSQRGWGDTSVVGHCLAELGVRTIGLHYNINRMSLGRSIADEREVLRYRDESVSTSLPVPDVRAVLYNEGSSFVLDLSVAEEQPVSPTELRLLVEQELWAE